jgi:hypothetical protein
MYIDDTHVLINARIYVGLQAHEIFMESPSVLDSSSVPDSLLSPTALVSALVS